MKKLIPLLALLLVSLIQCQNMKKENIDVSQALIKIDSCGLSYKGQHLELGTPIEDWVKVLGKPSRDTDLAYVWDDLGIAIDDWQNKDNKVTGVYIFFLNLDSPDAGKHMLNHASNWEKFDENKYKNGRIPMSDEMIQEVKERYSPKNYIYPFKVYQGVVNLHGFPVKAGMKVEEINKYRGDIPYSGKFGYMDQDIDGVNDSGVTTKTFGGDYKASGVGCKDGRLQYYTLTYTGNKNLEYLKIGYESKEDAEDRKSMQESFEKRSKTEK